MDTVPLSTLAFEPQLTALIILALLASIFLRRVPAILKWLLGFFAVICLFPGDRIANSLGNLVTTLLGPILTLGIIFVGLRMIVRGGSSHCSHCGCRCDRCNCRPR